MIGFLYKSFFKIWLEIDLIILNKRAVFFDISAIFSKSSIGKLINSGRELYSCSSFFAKGFTSFLGIVKNRISSNNSSQLCEELKFWIKNFPIQNLNLSVQNNSSLFFKKVHLPLGKVSHVK